MTWTRKYAGLLALLAIIAWLAIAVTPRPAPGVFTGTGKITGACNSATGIITLPSTPRTTGSVQVFINGILMTPTEDYTLSGVTVTPVAANSNWCSDPATVVTAFYLQ